MVCRRANDITSFQFLNCPCGYSKGSARGADAGKAVSIAECPGISSSASNSTYMWWAGTPQRGTQCQQDAIQGTSKEHHHSVSIFCEKEGLLVFVKMYMHTEAGV